MANHSKKLKVKQRDYVCIMSEADKASANYMADLRHAAWETDIPRRRWVSVIYDALCAFEGELKAFNMEDWFAPEVVDVFGKDDDSARWVSNFAQPRDKQKPIRTFQRNITDRITLIDLYFRLVDPELAARFGQQDAFIKLDGPEDPKGPNPNGPPPDGLSPNGPEQNAEKPALGSGKYMVAELSIQIKIYIEILNPDDSELQKQAKLFLQERAHSLGYQVANTYLAYKRPDLIERKDQTLREVVPHIIDQVSASMQNDQEPDDPVDDEVVYGLANEHGLDPMKLLIAEGSASNSDDYEGHGAYEDYEDYED